MPKPAPVSIRRRLTLSFVAVLLLGMALAAALAWLAVERQYLDAQRENLLAQARITASALQGAELPLEAAEPYLQTSNIAPGIHTRLIGEGGAVVLGLPRLSGDAPVEVPTAEEAGAVSPAELLQRPEIRQAMQGLPGATVRRVAAAGNRRVLYAAAPVLSADGSLAGIAYLATPLPKTGLPFPLVLQLAGSGALALLLAGVAATFVAGRIARPLEELANAADAVSAGDLGQHVPAETDVTELRRVGESFNAMTASLRRSDQAKMAFLADVTHELRSPLTVIKGTIETLEDGALDDLAGRGPLLTSMQRETDRLIRMVNDLLVLTRADAGALRLDQQLLDLGELARARCEHLAPLAALRRVHLQSRTGNPGALCTRGDPDRLAQVCDNLLDNAIRYAPEGSVVTVDVRGAGDRVACAVSDCGPGISAQHLPLIFERFYRADASRDRHQGGAGLGLAIARALVQAHGGSIDGQSVEGQGTTITFWLPAAEDCPTTD